jgi:hypothetical protein
MASTKKLTLAGIAIMAVLLSPGFACALVTRVLDEAVQPQTGNRENHVSVSLATAGTLNPSAITYAPQAELLVPF